MRRNVPFTAVCSSTLELGVDIGNVRSVGQIGAPWSVNSLLQRLGRSGRRDDEPHVMRMYLQDSELRADASLLRRLRPELLQAIALTELMLEKPKWIEPPEIDDFDLSTLVQQALSVIAETGGISASALFERLVTHGAFRRISQATFAAMLRSIASHDLIEQSSDGSIILGLVGETIVRHYDFYSAFLTPVEYAVSHDGRLIGQLPATSVPRQGQCFLLAGRRWMVIGVDDRRRDISVAPTRGRKSPNFLSAFGDIHPRVRHKMREVLFSDCHFAYLDAQAGEWLANARDVALNAGLLHGDLFEDSDGGCIWFTWTGTRAQTALMLMLTGQGLNPEDWKIAVKTKQSTTELLDRVQALVKKMPTNIDLAAAMLVKQRRKFDQYLDDGLLAESLAESAIDLPEAMQVIQSLAPYLIARSTMP